MTARPLLTLTAAAWLGLATAGVCAGQGAFFDEGNQRYQEGDFDGALERYAQILDDGLESGELYYNIGNTYFKLGELGPAILYYERARRLMPGDGDLLANLELARSLTADEIAPLPGFWLFRAVGWWVGLLPRGALAWLVAMAYLMAITAAILVILPAFNGARRVGPSARHRRRDRDPRLRCQPGRSRAGGRRRRGGGDHGRGDGGPERAVGR